MNHLSHEDFVLSYYGEPELGADRREHLQACQACRAELQSLAAVLDRVTPLEVPEPAPDFEARVWDRLQWRLRGERKRARGSWMKWIAVAAMLAVAFAAGLFVARRPVSNSLPAVARGMGPDESKNVDRVLLVVVGEHFDQSERMLVELTNLTPDGTTDISSERDRAQELLASNRIYRTSAADRGEGDVATLLDELEPVLLQLAHAPDEVSADELRSMQKRVENKELVFKLRVVRADVHRTTRTAPSTNI